MVWGIWGAFTRNLRIGVRASVGDGAPTPHPKAARQEYWEALLKYTLKHFLSSSFCSGVGECVPLTPPTKKKEAGLQFCDAKQVVIDPSGGNASMFDNFIHPGFVSLDQTTAETNLKQCCFGSYTKRNSTAFNCVEE